jgi:GntR family transcriptional regulator / MocR family aminotransferase
VPILGKMREPIDLEPLFPDRDSGESLQSQLVRRLRKAIKSGFFPPASRLLPSRELARRFGVSRNTVTSALDQLVAEGYLEASTGRGTFVTGTLHERRTLTEPPIREVPQSALTFEPLREKFDAVGDSSGPLRVGAPSLAEFPARVWQRLVRKNFASIEAALDYGDPSGLFVLREAIARHIAQFRGVVAEPSRITIVEGVQGALQLVAFVLATCGDTVAIEDPCYQNASATFRSNRLVLKGVPVDAQGLRTSELPRSAALLYLTPSHQFPLGASLSLARRHEVLDWARACNAYVVEDDYDSEFGARPTPALQSIDRDERVIYLGTFSKTLAPGLRLGYVVAPAHLAQTFRFARRIASMGSSTHLQMTVADFIAEGHFSRHVRRMTKIYDLRRRIAVDVLSKSLPNGFALSEAQTGLHLCIIGPPGFDDVRAANSLPSGNRVIPLSLLCVDRTDRKGLVFGFSCGTNETVERAARMLAMECFRARLEASRG